MPSRIATLADVAGITHILRLAFADDPVWGPALRRSDRKPIDLEAYWRLFTEGGIRFETAMLATDGAAASVWLPPGASELSDRQAATLEAMLDDALDTAARAALTELFGRFETSRAGRPAHYYLSLLATHPDHRGQGRGQILLAESLALWDAQGVPAYLESTNAANDHRYVRAGFHPDGGFRAVRDDTWVSAMWRPVGG
jgi:GNAT superfamily N-acetyltransferase